MNRASILPALLFFAAGCSCPPIETGSGGAGGTSGSPLCPVDDCDPTAGELPGKVACDDAEAHTADRCVSVNAGNGCGVCAHVRVECDGFDDEIIQAVACDDGDLCTTDRCLVSACVHGPIGGCP